MQESMPEPPVLAARNEHAHLGSPVAEIVGDDLEDRPVDPAVGAVHDLERDPHQTEPLPFLAERSAAFTGSTATWTARSSSGSEGPGVLQCASRRPVELVDEHQHRVAAQDRRLAAPPWPRTSSSASSDSYWRFSRTSKATMTGTSNMMNHAPPVNLVTAMTMVTMPVASAPPPLMARPSLQPFSLMRRWRLAMPACERVNDVNTPMA